MANQWEHLKGCKQSSSETCYLVAVVFPFLLFLLLSPSPQCSAMIAHQQQENKVHAPGGCEVFRLIVCSSNSDRLFVAVKRSNNYKREPFH